MFCRILKTGRITAFNEIQDFGQMRNLSRGKILKKTTFVGFFQNFFEKNQ